MSGNSTVHLTADEIDDVRLAMRDLQVTIADYYRETSGFVKDASDVTRVLSNFIGFVQALNEILEKDVSDSATYESYMTSELAANSSGAETIMAMKYARQIVHHLRDRVAPFAYRTVGNQGLGFRTSCSWEPVDASTHSRLRTGTKKLRKFYDAHLLGSDVLDSMLDAVNFFAEVCPQAIHVESNGEWTGFPLRHQAGVQTRLHPGEPRWSSDDASSILDLHQWMNGRRPGGDLRVITGCVTLDGAPHLVGVTFRNRFAYSVFAEAEAQVERDIEFGYPYHRGLPRQHIRLEEGFPDISGGFPDYYASPDSALKWVGDPIENAPRGGNYSTLNTIDFWVEQFTIRQSGLLSRRMQRLAAWFPIL